MQNNKIAFKNVNIFDASGEKAYKGSVLIEGNRISKVLRENAPLDELDAQVIDGKGAFLMPGMTEAHTHFGWNDQPDLMSIQMMPPEEHILWCVQVAKRVLEMGWTSCFSAATAKPRLDVVLRNAINAGQFPGPRFRACSQEITTIGALGDNTMQHLPYPELNFGSVCCGPEEIRKSVRTFAKYGVDQVKINLSGEYIAGIAPEQAPFAEDEIRMLVSEAKRFGKQICAHARSSESVQQCIRHGIEVIYHASFVDDETLDLLEANKDKHFVAPGLAWLVRTVYNAEEYGITTEVAEKMGYKHELEAAIKTMQKMHKRGIRILPGGDYGFAWLPHGTNARDLEYFTTYLGMSNMDTLIAATRFGGELMGQGNELGQIKEGYLADLLLVNGDPLTDIRVLQKAENIALVMKDGVIHKSSFELQQPLAQQHRALSLA